MTAAYKDVKQLLTEVVGGSGMKGRQERLRSEHLAAMEAQRAATQARIEAELAAIGAPWRDPEWQAEARRMVEERQRQAEAEAVPGPQAEVQEHAPAAEMATDHTAASGISGAMSKELDRPAFRTQSNPHWHERSKRWVEQ
jgi:hypothetical protein